MIFLVINFRDLFPPNKEEISEMGRGFSPVRNTLQEPFSGFTQVLCIERIKVIFKGKFSGFQMTVLVVKFKKLFPPTANEFYKTERFFFHHKIVLKNLLHFLHRYHILGELKEYSECIFPEI